MHARRRCASRQRPCAEQRIDGVGLIVDLFAGGGGASEALRRALGRSPDYGINHDPEAIALHAANHPETHHLLADIRKVTPRDVIGGRPVYFLWASPDCTFFSKARGAKPHRDVRLARGRRGLAGYVIKWVDQTRPQIVAMENVEEFEDWGPLNADGLPDTKRKGSHFRRFIRRMRALGYNVEWRELRAHDYGAPTIRKRLYVIARRDGQPIVWPDPTHGTGLQPYRTAAECIDWSIPCPSIFGRKKPLAEKTLARIARGIQRFVIDSPSPFIVPVNHGGDLRVHSINEPLRTITGAHRGEHAVVTPFVSKFYGTATGQPAEAPLDTVTTKDRFAVVAPTLVKNMTNNVGQPVTEPLSTILTGNHHFLAAASLVHSGNGEREGQAPRVYDLRKPLTTIMAEGQKHAVVATFLAKHNGGHEATGSEMTEPVHTVTCGGQMGVVTSAMVKLKGTCRDGQDLRQPAPTVCASGTHLGEVRAFLTKYYGHNGQGVARAGQSLELPFDTVTTARRFGLVVIHGETYEIADIGFRMLQPRELYNAQGFPRSYKIQCSLSDAELERWNEMHKAWCKANGKRFKRRTRRELTQEAQIRMCGNSVAPDPASVLIQANDHRPYLAEAA